MHNANDEDPPCSVHIYFLYYVYHENIQARENINTKLDDPYETKKQSKANQ